MVNVITWERVIVDMLVHTSSLNHVNIPREISSMPKLNFSIFKTQMGFEACASLGGMLYLSILMTIHGISACLVPDQAAGPFNFDSYSDNSGSGSK